MKRFDLPQLYVAAAILIMFVIPVRLDLPNVFALAGCALAAAALVLVILAMGEFVRAQIPPWPGRTPERLITGGIYALGRNPIYLADMLLVLGLGLILGAPHALLLAPGVGAVLFWRFVLAEEARLAEALPDDWRDYSAKVRRWV